MPHSLIRRGRVAAALVTVAAVTALAAGAGPSRAGTPATPTAPTVLAGFSTHVQATHFLGGRAYTADHFFKQLRPGVLQGIVVRRLEAAAPVIEVEWAISAQEYRRLSVRDRRHWHPLAAAVDAGRLRVPGASAQDARKALTDIRGLYAQTLNLAGLDGGLPRGPRGVRSATHLRPGEQHAR